MTILFLSRLFYPHIGGVEKHVLEVGKRLVGIGYKVIVITEEVSKDIPVYQSGSLSAKSMGEIEGIKIYRISVGKDDWFKKFRIWRQLWKYRKLIKKADVVHCHDVFFWYLPFRFLYPKKPVYTTFHGYEDYPIPKKAIIIRKISEKLSKGNICVGDFIKKWYGTNPGYLTYGGADIVKSSKLKVQNDKSRNPNSAVFVGRLDEQTGITTYVSAVKLIRKKIPNFKFAVLGDGKFKKDIEKDVRVLGFQKNPEKYFEQYHFAFVSRYLSILEAMVYKRLVIAIYDNPIKKDYLQMAQFSKFIVTVNSKEDIFSKVIYYLKNPEEERRIVDKAYNWAKYQTWDKVSETYIKLWYKKIVEINEI